MDVWALLSYELFVRLHVNCLELVNVYIVLDLSDLHLYITHVRSRWR